MFSPQLCSVRTCVLIWSPPTRPSTRAPPWEPSPPPPSLSTWTTKQKRGTARFPLIRVPVAVITAWHRVDLVSERINILSPLNNDARFLFTTRPWGREGRQVGLPRLTHTLPRCYHLPSDITWSYWWHASRSRWLSWLGNTRAAYIHTHLLHNIWTVQLQDERCDGGSCHSLLSMRQKNRELYKQLLRHNLQTPLTTVLSRRPGLMIYYLML